MASYDDRARSRRRLHPYASSSPDLPTRTRRVSFHLSPNESYHTMSVSTFLKSFLAHQFKWTSFFYPLIKTPAIRPIFEVNGSSPINRANYPSPINIVSPPLQEMSPTPQPKKRKLNSGSPEEIEPSFNISVKWVSAFLFPYLLIPLYIFISLNNP